MLGDLHGQLLAEAWADEAVEVARGVLPAFEPGAHLAIGLLDQRLHPRDALVDDLGDGLAALRLRSFLVAEGLGKRLATPGPEAVDLATGVLDREGLSIVDAKPAGALLAGLPVGELEREGCHPGSW